MGSLLESVDYNIVNVHGSSPVAAWCESDANTINWKGTLESEVHLEPFVGRNVAEIRDDVVAAGAGGAPCVNNQLVGPIRKWVTPSKVNVRRARIARKIELTRKRNRDFSDIRIYQIDQSRGDQRGTATVRFRLGQGDVCSAIGSRCPWGKLKTPRGRGRPPLEVPGKTPTARRCTFCASALSRTATLSGLANIGTTATVGIVIAVHVDAAAGSTVGRRSRATTRAV